LEKYSDLAFHAASHVAEQACYCAEVALLRNLGVRQEVSMTVFCTYLIALEERGVLEELKYFGDKGSKLHVRVRVCYA